MNFLFLFSIFLLGGSTYVFLELLWRGFSHISMFFAGGLSFLILFLCYTTFAKDFPIILKCIIGSVVITLIEFMTGIFVNVVLGLKVWDYSSMPLNIMGQVCIYFSLIWAFLSVPIIAISNLIMKFIEI